LAVDSPPRDTLDLDRLSPKQQRLARFVAENPSFAAFATASDLAKRAGTSTATVVRFAQGLGFESYNEFQQNVRHSYLRTLRPLEALDSRSGNGRDLFTAQLYQDLDNLRRTLHTLHIDHLAEAARRIDAADNIVVISSGSYSAIGLVLSHHLRFMGYRALFEDRGGPHLSAAIAPLGPGDLVVGISFWKGSREIVKTLAWAADRSIPTIAITDTVYSPVAGAASISLVLPTESVSFFQSMVAPLSVVYGLLAHLAQHANHSRRRMMTAAEESYELLDVTYRE
jgi:DNA-binding MurR/RpiR family transcriptional regulator